MRATVRDSNALESAKPPLATRASRLDAADPVRRVLQNVLRFGSVSDAASISTRLVCVAATCPAFTATGSNSEYTVKWARLDDWRQDVPVVGWRQSLTQTSGSNASSVAAASRVGNTVVLVSVLAEYELDADEATGPMDLMLSRLGVPMPTSSPSASVTASR